MTTAIATTADVVAALGRSLTTAEPDRATALLLLATAAVEAETRRRFAPGTYTVGRKVRAGKVSLPATVDTVTEVRSVDQTTGTAQVLTGYTTRGRTIYGLPACFVEVDFTVTEAPPAEVVGVVAGIAAATISGPPVGASQESAGPFSVSYADSSGRVWLSASDKAILCRFRQPKSALELL